MKDFSLFLLRYTDTGIPYIKTDSGVYHLVSHLDSSLRRIFDGISYIISHHLCNPIFVKSHPAHTIRIHRDQLHFRICHPLLH